MWNTTRFAIDQRRARTVEKIHRYYFFNFDYSSFDSVVFVHIFIWCKGNCYILLLEGCSSPEYQQKKAHFYVFCDNPCGSVENGKLRVRCSSCKTGAFTVDRDPCCWEDVLHPDQVSGTCQNEICSNAWAEFYFKCARHPSKGEGDSALPLNLIKSNFKQIQCLACLDIW